MSAKSKSQVSTPPPSGSNRKSRARDRSRSPPASPTRISRLQEKQELQSLNDRLAQYIERVRHLETENSKLEVQLSSYHEVKTREVTNMKSLYENEIQQVRKALDKEAKNRIRIDMENNRLTAEVAELSNKLKSVTNDFNAADKDAKSYQARFNEVQNKYLQATGELKKCQNDLKAMTKEVARLVAECKAKTNELDAEILNRVDLQNQLQSLQENLQFKEQMYASLSESHRVDRIDVSEIDSQVEDRADKKYYEDLQQLRKSYEEDLRQNKEELKKLYEDKIRTLEAEVSRKSNLTANTYEQIRKLQQDVDDARKALKSSEQKNNNMEEKISRLEALLQEERVDHLAQITEMRESMYRTSQEYQDLMDIKTALDLELATYRKLLETEEARLKYTPKSAHGSGPSNGSYPDDEETPLRKRKRRFEEHESDDIEVHNSSNGALKIVAVDPDGAFVKITNDGTQDILLSNYQLRKTAGNMRVTFKFGRNVKLAPGAFTTVWSYDTKKKNSPPHDILLKNQNWPTGDEAETILSTKDEENQEELAKFSQKRVKRYHSTSYGYDVAAGYSRRAGEVDNTCAVM